MIRSILSIRKWARTRFLGVARWFFDTDEARQMVSRAIGPARCGLGGLMAQDIRSTIDISPYPDLGQPVRMAPHDEKAAIIITARFRTGSTMLWNLFRHVPGCTAYYEPFNERRWFDTEARGGRLDASHKNVDDYWREYNGLPELARYYRDDWSERDFFMDADFWAPEMKRYIDCLIERASGVPVLQFNRIDFRLPWIRRHFPGAKIVHLYRHPREQWCSVLKDPRCFPKDAPAEAFAQCDKFYLRRWVRDLKYQFPFLADPSAQHPYRSFYFIWRLSFLFGARYSDYSIAFEQLAHDPRIEIARLMDAVGFNDPDMETLQSLVVPPQDDRWPRYAPDDWFREHESYCEGVLREFIGAPRHDAMLTTDC